MGWFKNAANKMHLVRSLDGKLIASISVDALARILNSVASEDIRVDNGTYVFVTDTGFKYGNSTHAIYFWRGTTIDCIPSDVS